MNNFINPLLDINNQEINKDPCILVIFGATGDLTARKLIPALYNLAVEGLLPSHFVLIAFARRDKTDEIFREEMFEAASLYSRTKPNDPSLWKQFSERIFYHKSSFDDDAGYSSLKLRLESLDKRFGTCGNRLFYLSTQPSFFPLIVEKLGQHTLMTPPSKEKKNWTRVIIEKPFGHNLQSAEQLQKDLLKNLDERQIYRIDHYLGKETVQNLLVFRFTNAIFESIWNRDHIQYVEMTVGEDLGIGTRGNFFEEAGIMRDIVQNHMMQLLSLIAMEPPTSLKAESIRDEKVKVLEALRPFPKDEISSYVVRGQYEKGFIHGKPVISYRDEENVEKNSTVETYFAMKLYIDNWRWSNVPFLLRAGKRLPKKTTEIAIVFHKIPSLLFGKRLGHMNANVLTIRIQPNEGISLKMYSKVPGQASPIQPVTMDFDYKTYFEASSPEAYERLICDAIAGDPTLFAREDEVFASWKLLDPVLEHFKQSKEEQIPSYPAGSWGPIEAEELLKGITPKWRLL
jgi:glucose-6-phosphate 1-dehydrogenase